MTCSNLTDVSLFPNNTNVQFTNIFDNTQDFARVEYIALSGFTVTETPENEPIMSEVVFLEQNAEVEVTPAFDVEYPQVSVNGVGRNPGSQNIDTVFQRLVDFPPNDFKTRLRMEFFAGFADEYLGKPPSTSNLTDLQSMLSSMFNGKTIDDSKLRFSYLSLGNVNVANDLLTLGVFPPEDAADVQLIGSGVGTGSTPGTAAFGQLNGPLGNFLGVKYNSWELNQVQALLGKSTAWTQFSLGLKSRVPVCYVPGTSQKFTNQKFRVAVKITDVTTPTPYYIPLLNIVWSAPSGLQLNTGRTKYNREGGKTFRYDSYPVEPSFKVDGSEITACDIIPLFTPGSPGYTPVYGKADVLSNNLTFNALNGPEEEESVWTFEELRTRFYGATTDPVDQGDLPSDSSFPRGWQNKGPGPYRIVINSDKLGFDQLYSLSPKTSYKIQTPRVLGPRRFDVVPYKPRKLAGAPGAPRQPLKTYDNVMQIVCNELVVDRTAGSSSSQLLAVFPFDFNKLLEGYYNVQIPVNELVWRRLADVHIKSLSFGLFNGLGEYHRALDGYNYNVTFQLRFI